MTHRAAAWRILAKALILLGMAPAAAAQPPRLLVEGTFLCREQGDPRLERPARYVVVTSDRPPGEPATTRPSGYFQLGYPARRLVDHDLELFFLGPQDTVFALTRRVSREEVLPAQRVRLPVLRSDTSCAATEFHSSVLASARVRSLRQGPHRSPAGMALGASRVVGAVSEVAGFSRTPGTPTANKRIGATRGPARLVFQQDDDLVYVLPARGAPAFTSGLYSLNVGFSFTPARNVDEAVFTNPAALALSPARQIAVQGDFDDVLRASVTVPVSSTTTLAAGYSGLRWGTTPFAGFSTRALERDLAVAVAFRPLHWMGTGVTVKHLSRNVELTLPPSLGAPTSSAESDFDLDLSAAVWVHRRWLAGASLANVLNHGFGRECDDGAEACDRPVTRQLGVGMTHLRGPVNLGLDLVLARGAEPEGALGLSYVPVPDLVLNAGFVSVLNTPVAGVSYRGITYSVRRSESRGTRHLAAFRVDF
jgi:hypothetical protein